MLTKEESDALATVRGYAQFNAMWLGELARAIDAMFYRRAGVRDDRFLDWEMARACECWRDRNGHWPTVGEIALWVA